MQDKPVLPCTCHCVRGASAAGLPVTMLPSGVFCAAAGIYSLGDPVCVVVASAQLPQ